MVRKVGSALKRAVSWFVAFKRTREKKFHLVNELQPLGFPKWYFCGCVWNSSLLWFKKKGSCRVIVNMRPTSYLPLTVVEAWREKENQECFELQVENVRCWEIKMPVRAEPVSSLITMTVLCTERPQIAEIHTTPSSSPHPVNWVGGGG